MPKRLRPTAKKAKKKRGTLTLERVSLDAEPAFRATAKPRGGDKRWRAVLASAPKVASAEVGALYAATRETHTLHLSEYDPFVCRPVPDGGPLDWSRIPAKIGRLAFPYQKEGIRRSVMDLGGRNWFADEMGLGKSMASIAVTSYYRGAGTRHLIVCPSYLRHNWRNELRFWTECAETDVFVVAKTSDVIDERATFVIVSYELACRKSDALSAIGFRTAIVDEAHYLKSRTAKRTRLLTPLLHGIPRVLLLTGTPALSRPAELYTQLHILFPRTFRGFTPFALRYAALKKTHFGWDSSGSSNPSWGCSSRRA